MLTYKLYLISSPVFFCECHIESDESLSSLVYVLILISFDCSLSDKKYLFYSKITGQNQNTNSIFMSLTLYIRYTQAWTGQWHKEERINIILL